MPSRGKVLVAMSGGVDSSVAAALLLRAGYEVVGVFMRLGSPGETLDCLTPLTSGCPTPLPLGERRDSTHVESGEGTRSLKIGHQGCCSINDAADARLVAAELGIPFYVVNFKKDFGRIIDYFVDEYTSGRTPNPCVRCNDWLKFGKLHEYAKQIDADFVASGHYARVGNGPQLLRGIDHSKDQSYVLFGVPRDQLARMMLPIGEMRKPEVRELARTFGLPVFDKPDSQEICFVPDNDYAGLVERRRPDAAREGRVLDPEGHVVGTHDGQHCFTIGQRRGVGVALGYPIYVVDKDPHANTITVGPREMLLSTSCIASEANWLVNRSSLATNFTSQSASNPSPLGGEARSVADRAGEGMSSSMARCLDGSMPVFAKYRYNTPAVAARVTLLDDEPSDTPATPSGRRGRFRVDFDTPQQAVAPGQAIVLYDAEHPDVVLGGGWISQSH